MVLALGALISAYQEDDSGGLQALLPLAGRSLVEYQARCAAAAGASPIVLLVERLPAALAESADRLRREGIGVIAVSDPAEAVSRFEPGSPILVIGDGIVAPVDAFVDLASREDPAILTVPDDPDHEEFERIDAASRWAGLALVDSHVLSSTVAMLGDWDLQSTLLRKTVQAGAPLLRAGTSQKPILARTPPMLIGFERAMLDSSRTPANDVPSRYILPAVEHWLTERLMDRRVTPTVLLAVALAGWIGGAFALTRGWAWPALAAFVAVLPLDRVARRLATLRLRPLRPDVLLLRLLWPAAGLALLALGWWETRFLGDWGPFAAAMAAAAFAQAHRIERGASDQPSRLWLFSVRNAVLLALPVAAFGWWAAIPPVLAVYAATSFFLVQHVRHVGID